MKRYQGKKNLYEFLKSHGYDVPKMIKCEYRFYRGSEWLSASSCNIELYSPFEGVIFVTLTEVGEEGSVYEKERCRFNRGVLVYKTVYGKVVLSNRLGITEE